MTIIAFICTFYIVPFTFPKPVYATVPIGEHFGFSGPEYNSLGAITSKLMIPLFSIASFLVIIYFLIGAFKYLSSGGDKEAVAGARQMIIHAIIGFMVLMLAFLILQFLLSSLFLFKITDFQLF